MLWEEAGKEAGGAGGTLCSAALGTWRALSGFRSLQKSNISWIRGEERDQFQCLLIKESSRFNGVCFFPPSKTDVVFDVCFCVTAVLTNSPRMRNDNFLFL